MSNPAAPFVFDTNSRRFYHGTRADLKPGDLLQPGYSSNYTERRSPWIYFSETLHAATWGAELAKGEGPGRIYLVEPTGSFVDDPNLTDKKYPRQSHEVLSLPGAAAGRARTPGLAGTLPGGNPGNEGLH